MLTIPHEHQTVLSALSAFLAAHNASGWLAGGYLRDLLLGRAGYDLDVATDGPALELARTFADQTGGAFVRLDDATETARIVWKTYGSVVQPFVVDLVRLRAPTIADDLRLRDITINALALPLSAINQASIDATALLDPTGGLADLAARRIRPTGPTTLLDDPLRMLRVVRFAAQLEFSIAPETDALLRQHADKIATVAAERVRDELLKLLAARHAAPWLAYLDDVRLLTRIVPELEPARDCTQPPEHFLPVLDHLFETVCAWEWLYEKLTGMGSKLDQRAWYAPVAVRSYPDLPVVLPQAAEIVERMQQDVGSGHQRYALFKLAALLHDVGKPATREVKPNGRITFYGHETVGAELGRQIGQRLRLGREAVGYLTLIVEEHMRPGQLRALGPELTRRAVYRLIRDTGTALPDVLIHSLCDHMAVRGPHLRPEYWTYHMQWTAAVLQMRYPQQPDAQPSRLINGADVIQELGIEPGPVVGRVLAAIDEAQFMGDVRTRDEALALAARIVAAEQRTEH